MNLINHCAKCNAKGTAFESNLCLSCMANRDKLMREREGGHSSIISPTEQIYSNYSILNQYLSELRYILS
jgi:hypothetical protein